MKRLWLKLGKLEAIAFITGFTLMCFELVAARLLAPSIGSSTYVWTSVIGVIIAALATGYWIGGVVADRRKSRLDIAYLLLASALGVLLAQVMYSDVLESVALWNSDPRTQGVVATLLLFAPASFVIGMISPYLAKLNVTSLSVSGRRVASLGALNSLGGIAGTFLTGFVLLSTVGSRQLLVVLVVLLVTTSWLVAPKQKTGWRLVASIAFVAIGLVPTASEVGVRDIDTPSAHYQVVDYRHTQTGRPITGLVTGPSGIQSAVYKTGQNELVFWYTREMARITLREQPQRVLMLGGGAFTLPQALATALPDAKIDVVEIDPELLGIAKQHFRYEQLPNVTEYFDDARHFVNRAKGEYDVILVDVYGDGTIPFTFTTAEYGRQIERLLTDDGIVVANIIAGVNGGPCQTVFEVVDAAYRQVLPHGAYRSETVTRPDRANIVAVYSRQASDDPNLITMPFTAQAANSDNLSPTEQLYYDCRQATS